jgi:hypothetical protein
MVVVQWRYNVQLPCHPANIAWWRWWLPLGGVVVIISFFKATISTKCGFVASICCWLLKTVLELRVWKRHSVIYHLRWCWFRSKKTKVLVRHHHFAVCDWRWHWWGFEDGNEVSWFCCCSLKMVFIAMNTLSGVVRGGRRGGGGGFCSLRRKSRQCR